MDTPATSGKPLTTRLAIFLAALLAASSVLSQSAEDIAKLIPVLFDLSSPDPNADDDQDGLTNAQEIQHRTNPNNDDTDLDGLTDGYEVRHALDPRNDEGYANSDTDLDGLTGLEEQLLDSSAIVHNHDYDYDDVADIVDTCPSDADNDPDGDAVCANNDNCDLVANANQADSDSDGLGNACDSLPNSALRDSDGDGIADNADNCSQWPNSNQADSNGDGIGNSCQCGDINRDGRVSSADNTAFSSYTSIELAMPLNALETCDVDGDAVCTENDRTVLAQHLQSGATINQRCPSLTAVTNRALNRLAHGSDRWSRTRILALLTQRGPLASNAYEGIDRYVQEQLQPANIPDPLFNASLLNYSVKGQYYESATADYATVGKSIPDLKVDFCEAIAGDVFCDDLRQPIDARRRILGNAQEIKLLRSAQSRRQLDAKLLDFWFNHFNVSAFSEDLQWSFGHYETALHKNLYGSFAALLTASAKAPAMLKFLNLTDSKAFNSNENYARELLELHTLGLTRTGYTTYEHRDIVEVSRILTGWMYNPWPLTNPAIIPDSDAYRFYFEASAHDTATANGIGKILTIAGQQWQFGNSNSSSNTSCGDVYAAQGVEEGDVLLCLLAKEPSTAQNVSTKLVTRFIGEAAINSATEDTRGALIGKLIERWQATSGDLTVIVQQLLISDDFKRSLYMQDNQIKRPLQFAASLPRALGQGVIGTSQILATPYFDNSARLSFRGLISSVLNNGEYLYAYPPPTGLPEHSSYWLGAGNLLNYFNKVHDLLLGANQISDAILLSELALAQPFTTNSRLVDEISISLGVTLSNSAKNQIVNFLDTNNQQTYIQKVRLTTIGLLSSPEFIAL